MALRWWKRRGKQGHRKLNAGAAAGDAELGDGGDQAGDGDIHAHQANPRWSEQHGDRLGPDHADDMVDAGGPADDRGRAEDLAVGGAFGGILNVGF